MGTRADFYIGKGKETEWIGSIARDGYPSNKDLHPINTTDYAYALDKDKVEAFSGEWFDPLDEPPEYKSGSTEFPNMASRKRVALDGRSGLLFIQG